jgi:hypothetical protein
MPLPDLFGQFGEHVNVMGLAYCGLVYPLLLRDLSQLSALHASSVKLSDVTGASQTIFCLWWLCRTKLVGLWEIPYSF